MSQENVELVRAALNAFAELDEGLIDPERLEEFFAQDAITTFSGFGFLDEQPRFAAAMSSLSSAPPGWSRMTTSATSRRRSSTRERTG